MDLCVWSVFIYIFLENFIESIKVFCIITEIIYSVMKKFIWIRDYVVGEV